MACIDDPEGMSQGQRIVTKSGIGPGMHTVHVILTCITFGCWAPVWFLHWLIARRRSVAYVPPQQPVQAYPQPPYPPQQPYPYPQQWQQPYPPQGQYPQQPPQWPQQPPQQ